MRAVFAAGVDQLRFPFFALLLVFLVVLSGCGTGGRGGSIAYDVQNFGRPDAPSVTALDPDYRIAPMDTITVNVFQVEDLSGDYQVDLTGHIAMPLIGNVRAVDLSPQELQLALTERLSERYLRDPDVTVGVKASARRTVTVDGSVKQSGMFPVPGPTTLLQAVAMAGGPDDSANPHRVAIFRHIEGQRQAAAFDLVSIRRGEAEDPVVYSGDIIVVDGSRTRAMMRDVLQTLPILGMFRPF